MSSRDSEPRRSMGPPAASSKTSGDVSSKQRGPNPQTDYKRHFNRTKERFDVVTSEQTRKKAELDRASLKQAKLQEELEYLLDAIAGEKLHGNQLKQAAQRMHSPAAEQMYRQRQEEVFDISGDDEEFEQMYHEEQDNASKTKRQRPSPADTEDELLETAGVASKRFRED